MRDNIIRPSRFVAPLPSYIVTVEVGRSKIVSEKRAHNAAEAIADAINGLRDGDPLRVTAKRK